MIPEIPKKIIEAKQEDRLVIFIGAGISRLVGCQSWEELKQNFILELFNSEEIDLDKRKVLEEMETLKAISICRTIIADNNILLRKILEKACNYKNSENDYYNEDTIYDIISRFEAFCITTNWDKYFDKNYGFYYNDRILYKLEHFSYREIRDYKRKLFHIHGSIRSIKSMVLTITDYIELYKKQDVLDFIRNIFNENTVLFMGYGLKEMEILRSLTSSFSEDKQHFLLKGFTQSETTLRSLEEKFYEKMGIKLIGFDSTNGFKEIESFLKNWLSKLEIETSFIVENYETIENIVREGQTENFSELRIYMNQNLKYIKKVFQELAKVPNPIIWLEQLKQNDLIGPNSQLLMRKNCPMVYHGYIRNLIAKELE
ncbi:MAG: hypothetical protein GF364_14945, partial [Candidatus Lokiarchaeota archaeon]|nr:hypothetical protein [Candidatus Lokiarchaeota archaeon]